MNDVFIPLSDTDPVVLIERVTQAAKTLNRVAAAFGFVIQYGPGNTEVSIVLRGPGKNEAHKASALEKSLPKSIIMQFLLPRVLRVNVATAIHSSLLYDPATWPQ